MCWFAFCLLSCFSVLVSSKTTLDILMMGDFGGTDEPPYTTQQEVDTANSMGIVASKYDIDNVWVAGDNFYPDGVTNLSSIRFNETFENVFTAESLLYIPYYVILGNHDYRLNVTAQILYTNVSERWNLPTYYYNKIFYFGVNNSISVELIMIDTIILVGQSYGYHKDDIQYCKEHNITLKGCSSQPLGPENETLANIQYSWIESKLQESSANYLIVMGHYPIYSVGEHGSTDLLISNLDPLLHKYNVTAYLAGHEHSFEYFYYNNMGYIVGGGTHECETYTNRHIQKIPKNSLLFHNCIDGGYLRYQFNQTQMNIYFYYGNTTEAQYQTPPLYPRF